MTVAALYVDPNGVYAGLPDVELWDEARGPWPVVAHPPCAAWSIMGNCRPETRAAGDGGCFAAALDALYRFAGVLEHPAHSRAWATFNLPCPVTDGWSTDLYCRGFATEIDQRRYGHEARKPTWLYYVGPEENLPALLWGRGPRGERTVGRGWGGGRERLRAATPPEFRDVLLEMARSAGVAACA